MALYTRKIWIGVINMNKYKIDTHTHTVSSGHAYSTVTENAKYAASIGLEIIGMTDHAPKMPGSCGYLHFLNLRILPEYIEGVRVLKGIELNILDSTGKVDMSERILKNLDIAIASLHLPCIDPKSEEDFTETLINVIKNPLVNIIGHPGDPRYPIDVKKLVTAARDYNTLLEINNSSLDPNGSRAGGDKIVKDIILECKRQDMPIILGSDAHYMTSVGDFTNVQKLLDEVQMPDELIINTDTEAFKKFIKIYTVKISLMCINQKALAKCDMLPLNK